MKKIFLFGILLVVILSVAIVGVKAITAENGTCVIIPNQGSNAEHLGQGVENQAGSVCDATADGGCGACVEQCIQFRKIKNSFGCDLCGGDGFCNPMCAAGEDPEVDPDCIVCVDNDEDGYDAITPICPTGDDCNDNNANVYPGATEVCDGVDNDCDSSVDEDYIETSTSCGVGECSANGLLQCIAGSEVDSCTAGTPSAEVCDGLDNDCDDLIDENLGSTTCGIGKCQVTIQNCIGGVVQTCMQGSSTPEVCIDGIISPGEWDPADTIGLVLDLTVNVPEGGTTPARLYVMNDAANLYLALRFERTVADPGNSLSFEFDNDNDGIREEGDDAIVYNAASGFYDDFRMLHDGRWGGPKDIAYGGTSDGEGAFLNDGTYSVYEMSHPLDSADDLHDFSLSQGYTIGFYFHLRMIGPGGVWPEDYGETYYPSYGNYMQFTVN